MCRHGGKNQVFQSIIVSSDILWKGYLSKYTFLPDAPTIGNRPHIISLFLFRLKD